MIESRHFLPGASTVVSIFGAISAADITAWGGAFVALAATCLGLIHDTMKKRDQRKDERSKASRAERWQKYCLKKRMEALDAGHADPFPNGLPPLEAEDDEHDAK